MRFKGNVTIYAALAAIGLGASTVYAQKNFCEHAGRWVLVNGHYVCSGDYAVSTCVWTDDCRVNVD